MNKDIVRMTAMTARIVLTGLILLLTGGNAAAQGVHVEGNVFGGGNLAEVGGSVVVNIKAGTVAKDVYGGGALANTNTSNWNPTGVTYKPVSVTVDETVVTGLYEESSGSYTVTTDETASEGKTYYQQIIGTWASGMVDATGKTTYFTTVNLTGGTINGDAYGGGLGRLPESVHYTQEEADAYNREHGLSSGDSGYKTTDDWQPEVKATVYGDISVNLGKNGVEEATVFKVSYYDEDSNTDLKESEIVKSGRVFGSNNLNGSPQGNVTVTVYSTGGASDGSNPRTASGDLKSETASLHKYQLAAVYGGGNLANYEPTTSGKKAHVIIKNCANTSILTVYGGGNAAAVPETDVDIYGSYEIGSVFGGGNGKDPYKLSEGASWTINSGANVNGNANTMMYGGLIHEAFGGSNEKGTITGNVSINTSKTGGDCTLDVGTIYGAGKNADIDGDLIMVLGCKTTETEAVYGGAENANVKGKVELTITSGKFGRVFGGNNTSGAIFGSITLNIMESGCSPIEIDELYGGGYLASYSIYGYYVKTSDEDGIGNVDETAVLKDGKLQFVPRVSADDPHLPVKSYTLVDPVANTWTWEVYPITGNGAFTPYKDPVVNIVAATSIGKVFGGGYGEGAVIYGSPTVNINQAYPLKFKSYTEGTTTYEVRAETLGEIGTDGVYGGGNQAKVVGNTTINIGTEQKVDWTVLKLQGDGDPVLDDDDKVIPLEIKNTDFNTVRGANIAGNVYGGGNEADVSGNTFVNICAVKSGTTYNAVAEGSKKVTIAGNVFGGGKGITDNFYCDKAMVGTNDKGLEDNYTDGNTSVIIGNGTVNRNVYGGGEVGRVEMNTTVTVGLPGTVTSSPDIKGDVFGGGMGDKEHGYAGLVRGNPTVTIQANTKVEHNVYGGGEIASVARYKVPITDEDVTDAHNAGYPDAVKGRPYALKDPNSGFCTVTVQGNAVIGPDYAMEMTKAGGPDDAGHVFGAGKGIMPENYDYDEDEVGHKPRCRANNDSWTWFADIDEYIAFIQTLALSSQTTVNIGDASDSNSKPFIKGSVYGGSENGLVQFDTNVNIIGGQIGCGKNANGKPHPDGIWADDYVPDGTDYECASWDYGKEEGSGDDKRTVYAPYDPNANATGELGKYSSGKSTEGGRRVASDGHTFYGNVFGGGSGSVPYFDTTEGISKYLHSAGTVKGNTNVTISGGHILTSVYGGCEATNVMGTANVTMTGGTVGVPRTDDQILAHPVTCNLYGAGKGDQRVFFNKDTNVNDAVVTVSGGRIYGSVFGGGEDGHIMRNSTVTISGANTKIGTKGTSYMDGNVFGGGRGFGGDALTAGNVGGAVTLNIENGYVLGSVYGGGRLASVGYGLYLTTETGYGEMRADDVWDDPNKPITSKQTAAEFFDKGRGKITINISGGTIGNDVANAEYGGNVFGGSMGSLTKQDGTLNTQWDKFATAKKTTVNVSGGTIKRSVYGGGELGTVTTDAVITVSGGTIGKPKEGTTVYGGAVYGNIYGGGKGYVDPAGSNYITAGIVKGNTYVTVENSSTTVGETTTTTKPTIYHNIYGGGAYGSVGDFNYDSNTGLPTGLKDGTTGGTANITITGGIIGTDGKENGMVFGSSRGDVDAPGSIQDKLAWVYDTHVTIGTSGQGTTLTTPLIKGSVYGSGENGHTFNDTEVIVHSGTIGIAEGEPITDNNGTPDVATDDKTYSGAAYPYRGNVYGGGCGTDKYYQNPTGVTNPYDGNGDTYNPLAGIVYGTTTVTMDGGQVVHNIYGAGAMGSVGKMNTTGAITSGGTTTIEISGGTVGVDGTVDDGNVFGAARGNETAPKGIAQVKTTNVTISGTATGTIIKGNVYGGGQLGDVGTYTYDNTSKTYTWDKIGTVETGDCHVTVNGGMIAGYVYGAGKGIANTFECEKALVRTTNVSINAGTVNHNVYGGGEIGRVDQDTKVTLGAETGTSGGEDAIIVGEVFGAGKGLETHGYSALVRGNAEVIAQGNATVGGSVYGGGEIAAVGRYRLDDNEMPTALVSGGECKVTVKGYAVIGQSGTGNVFGAGKGVNPSDATHTYIDFTSTDTDKLPKRMTLYTNNEDFPVGATTGIPTATPNGSTWEYCEAGSPYVWEYYTSQDSYFKFLQTLALATDTKVSIEGNATVNGNVYGGSESGFVQRDTDVKIKGGDIGSTGSTTEGNVFGGGKGLDVFAEAGRVRGNATVAISGGNIAANVYGGGELGHVGSFTETADGRFDMVKIKDKDNNDMDTGLCTVTITGGKVGSDTNTDSKKGNVFGAGKGKDDTFKCEKAMAMNTSVSINTGAVNGDVFGGGEIGRVEYNSRVTMGSGSVKRSIFGGGAGVETHGYSALVRGNTTVTILGGSVGESVYGGGEIASVGRYGLDAQKMPSILLGGGYCYVTVKGSATIGSATEAGDVFGAGKGVTPHFNKTDNDHSKRSRRMTVYNADDFPNNAKISETNPNGTWEYYDENATPKLVWEYFQDETKYNDYLETLALATHPEVNIDGDAHVYGSVFGGGELGITKGSVFVNILGGTIEEDVYGGGSLANTNTTDKVGLKNADESPQYEDEAKTIIKTTTVDPKTKVNLLGGHIKGDAYGGGLGRLDLPASDTQPAVTAIEAKVYGDVKVNLNGLQSVDDMNATTVSSLTSLVDGDTGYKKVKSTAKGAIVKRVFGCNNLNGSPQKKVQVYIFGTQSATTDVITNKARNKVNPGTNPYDVAAVYGGGNLSPYVPADALLPYTDENKATVDAARTEVYIDGCDRTSIQQVYGGGNAASAPATFVRVDRCYEIDEVFGGGNGFDNYSLDERGQTVWYENPGANVGYYTGYYTNYATYSNHATRVPGGGGSGTSASDPYKAVVNAAYAGDADKKPDRYAATDIQYGSGIATLEVKGGTIHTSYGGSNSKGNVRALLSSVYSAAFDDCEMSVGTSYGGGKNAYSDADSDMQADCAKGVKTMFGGSENADFDGNINMRITNGSSLQKVFGGNNTSGAVNGSITITIEEGGCEPIHIDELYLGGFLAPYSVYGYKKTNGIYDTEDVEYIDTDGSTEKKTQRIPLESGTRLYDDPRINVISATYIGDIFGGGYQAKLVGNPHINVNMTTGFVKVTKTLKEGTTDQYIYKDVAGNEYAAEKVSEVSLDPSNPDVKSLIATTDLGTIGNIYGGGNMADIVGDTYVEIGTGTEHNAAGTEYVTIEPARNAAKITGNVFGGGNNGVIKGDTHVYICTKYNSTTEKWESVTPVAGGVSIDKKANGADDSGGSVYGGGCSADVLGNTFVRMSGGYVFNGVFGGGYAGSVGKFTRKTEPEYTSVFGHTTHEGECIGKPVSCEAGTGKCTVVVDGGQIGPITVATKGMNRPESEGGPVPQGWVWGGGQGLIEDPEKHPDTHFKSYVGSTDVTIGGTALIMESIIGGGEFGRVLGNTLVKIQGGQIGVGYNPTATNVVPYDEDKFVDPTTTTISTTNALTECSHFPFGREVEGKKIYETYDPYADAYKTAKGSYCYPGGVTDNASDGKTWIGCVFGGGSGYMPYVNRNNSDVITDYDWVRSAGLVEGNSEVRISGGHILTNVYGGNEYTDVLGKSIVRMSGGTVGVPRTKEQIEALPMCGYIFGAGKGDERTHFNTSTNVGSAEVEVSGGIVYGSVYGGGEDGHVLGDVTVTIKDGAKIGTVGTSYFDGNVFGGGRGFSGVAQTAGTVGGNVTLNIEGGKMLGSVYGGGRLASVGTMFEFPTQEDGTPNPAYGNFVEDAGGKTYGHVTVNISGGTIGNEKAAGEGAKYSGNVFGGSMGRLDLLDGTRNPIWPKMAQVKNATVNISGDAVIRRSVYGGGELGTVRDNAYVTIGGTLGNDKTTVTKNGSPTVRRDVYGGGYGSENRDYTVFTVNELKSVDADPTDPNSYEPHTYGFTPMQFAGCVGQNTYVNIAGGYIRKSVYGGGEMASVGVINYRAEKLTSGTSTSDKVVFKDEYNVDYFYSKMVKHADETKEFALSWPYKFEYVDGYPGATHVKVTGGRLGLKSDDEDATYDDNGDVYGAGKGQAGDYKDFVFCANVGSTDVYIKYDNTAAVGSDDDCISGAAYGGGEDGHVMGDTKLTLVNGLVAHSIYGAGSGKGKFTKWLTKIPEDRRTVVTSGGTGTAPETNANGEYKAECYSITAGKVFGASTVEMIGGHVARNVYGGGNMGSVGKGNYAGGADDYSTAGYGEKLTGNLWDGVSDFSKAFLNSGKCTVMITGGTVGYIASNPSKSMYPLDFNKQPYDASLPYGNVFGGCRGESAPNITESPRYLYSPEFFVGYVNETDVTIGKDNGEGPTILGSVYGGGMDGHVRRDTHVEILGGEIGIPYTSDNIDKVQTDKLNNVQWLARGNVYGAGSGIGKYKYDFNYDGDFGDVIDYKRPEATTSSRMKEEDNSTSAGSVTRFTKVEVKGGKIHRNVYGGGSLSSIGGPKIPPISIDPYRKGDTTDGHGEGKQSLNEVIISGSTTTIGDGTSYDAAGNHVYGGCVFGASRGDETLTNPSSFASSVWTDVKVMGGTIVGEVYGGGEVGTVRQGANVQLTGGIVGHDVYGGGKGTSTVAADVGGDVLVDLNNVAENAKGAVVKGSVFGANNVNGTPKGHVKVYVHGTQNETTGAINEKVDGRYDVKGVFGGGKQADYVPYIDESKQSTEVIIEGCGLTSIEEVYGGGYGAATPGTEVWIKGTYIIDNVFGGGYGESTNGFSNPGANVGYRTAGQPYGAEGKAVVQLMAGNVNNVYGGSNSKGDIRGGASIRNPRSEYVEGSTICCPSLNVGKVFGGGKNAEMQGGSEIILGCLPYDWIGEIYAGAENADVGNDVSLTLTSGRFERVFGGNKSGGRLAGSIMVNIEESGECETPIVIGELYGGGNLAPYSVYGYYQDGTDSEGNPVYKPRTKDLYDKMTPQEKADEGIKSAPHNPPTVNVRSFTSIGRIFGGGLGESAVMVGDPTVNINEVQVTDDEGNLAGKDYPGDEALTIGRGTESETTVKIYPHTPKKMGVIGTVFGGGNAAKVIGSTNVNVGTTSEEPFISLPMVEVKDENGNPIYLNDEHTLKKMAYQTRPVVGVDIRGNVYGGGNEAEVTGDTNVTIGKEEVTTP